MQEGIAPVPDRRRWYVNVLALFVSGPFAFAAFSFGLLFVLMPVWLAIGVGAPALVTWLTVSSVLALFAVRYVLRRLRDGTSPQLWLVAAVWAWSVTPWLLLMWGFATSTND